MIAEGGAVAEACRANVAERGVIAEACGEIAEETRAIFQPTRATFPSPHTNANERDAIIGWSIQKLGRPDAGLRRNPSNFKACRPRFAEAIHGPAPGG